jgi:hypothetical protein
MEQLITLLQSLEDLPDIKLFDGEYISGENPGAREAASLAESLLIHPNGGCSWDAIDELRGVGYDVFPLERDAFGWLIGGIQTSAGVLIYG